MKMKLIALCVTMASASAIASDWVTGDFNGGIDFGGTIEKTEYPAKWQWKAGSSITGLNATTNDLRENGTKLIISVNENKPILLGKTAEAFFSHTANVEASPQITFKDYNQNAITLMASGSSDGTHYLELPIKEQNGDAKLGTLKINVTAAGAVVKEKDDTTADLNSIDAVAAGDVFYGGLNSTSVIESGATAASKTSVFGSLSADELLSQVQTATNKTLTLNENSAKKTETLVGGKFTSAAYAMAIAAGQELVAKFDSAVSSKTDWTAPLTIEVRYQ